jgi:hypothetical protein
MILEVSIVLLSIFFGPCVFLFLSYREPDLTGFPLGVVDGVGDTVMLPVMNAVVLSEPVLWRHVFIALPISIVFAVAITSYTVYHQELDEWSRPSEGETNIGTWYHGVYMTFEIGVFFIGGLSQHSNELFVLSVAGYAATALYSYVAEF